MGPYRFVSHDRVPTEPPAVPVLDKALRGETLTRAEKDRAAEMLYGVFGSQSSGYRLAGWLWPMNGVFPRILVRLRHYGWKTYYAPDKTSLRRALPMASWIEEMHYLPERRRVA